MVILFVSLLEMLNLIPIRSPIVVVLGSDMSNLLEHPPMNHVCLILLDLIEKGKVTNIYDL